MNKPTTKTEEVITKLTADYRKTCLLELLAEENEMARFLYGRIPSSTLRKLRYILRSEIEKRLR